MIPFRCQCGKTYQLKEQNAGQQVRCKCGRKSIVPGVEVTQSQLPAPLQQTPDANVGVTVEATAPKSSGEKDRNYGNHRLVRLFARGGMGQVNIARDESLKREVALKELFENAVDRKDVIQRFCDEAEITARLEHPGIVPVHAFGTDAKGKPYYTMKLVHGQTLQEAIKRYHTLPDRGETKTATFRDLVRRFASVCQTISFAHEKGIIHRDLKPANIMLGEYGETLVMDWGLAKPYASGGDSTMGDLAAEALHNRPDITEAGRVIGTPYYMSPEQASGDPLLVGPYSDIYSLGVILYQILTGQLPHTGKISLEIIKKILAETPQNPSEVTKGVPKDLEAICLTAMAREPSRRYKTATQIHQDLTNWLDDEPISVRKETRQEKVWRWVRKNRALATTLLLAAFALLIVLGVSGVLIQRARTEVVAKTMLADEMKRRVAEKEKELADKVDELATLRAQYANLAEDAKEREELKKRIDTQIGEIAVLEQELAELRALATELLGETNPATPINNRAKIIEQEMTQRLIEKLEEAKKTWKELIQVSQKVNDVLTALQTSDAENKGRWVIEYDRLMWNRTTTRLQLNQCRHEVMLLSTMTNAIPRIEVQRICDRLPLDLDVITSPNAVFVEDYVIEAEVGWHGRPLYFKEQEQKSPIFAGKQCDYAIFAHATSRIKLTVPAGVDRFTAVGGLNQNLYGAFDGDAIDNYYDQVGSSDLWFYQILFDDEVVYESTTPLDYPGEAIVIDLSIPADTKTITLVINDNGRGNISDVSCWGWPMFHFKEGMKPPTLTEAEYRQLREKYPELELSENMADYNVIVLRELTDAELRRAVEVAGNTVKDDLIVARTTPSDNRIVLSGTAIAININADEKGSVTLVGFGDEKLTFDAGNRSKVFYIDENPKVALAGLTITGGGGGGSGGGIFCKGELIVTDCAISGNSCGYGGGIFSSGIVTLINSSIYGNTATSYGGGIDSSRTGTLTITNCAIYDNTADNGTDDYNSGSGGGIFNAGTATISNSTITKNATKCASAGGIWNGGTLTLDNTIISGNAAKWYGGGLQNEGTETKTVIVDCTFSGNTAGALGGAMWNSGNITITNSTITGNNAGAGGGVFLENANLSMVNTTLTENRADIDGGGVYVRGNGVLTLWNTTITSNQAKFGGGLYFIHDSHATLINTIIANNAATDERNDVYQNAYDQNAVLTGSHNIIGMDENTAHRIKFQSGNNSNRIGTHNTPFDAGLGPLMDFGNGISVVTLLPNSPAIDAGTAYDNMPKTDAAGHPRVVGSSIDIGAYEFQGEKNTP